MMDNSGETPIETSTNSSQKPRTKWYRNLTNFFRKTKEATENSIAERVEEWVELLKTKYLSDETREILDDLKNLIGKINVH